MSYSFNFNRPISPHILAYSPVLTLLRSILHRITGVILSIFFIYIILILKLTLHPLFLILPLKTFCFPSFLFSFFFVFLSVSFGVYHTISGSFSLKFNYNF
uniref:succinate dehydrogenase subunit 3 n=1 Tax=Pseudoceramium inkyui TaxID=196910 RepID=UPI002E7866CE|nr:succinate dehydrogenase subunit 3 [Pseudoceramium inkyui]WQF69629.1 succinate dehydrogenase subunit 3 [Pseudoceramium inkyui]